MTGLPCHKAVCFSQFNSATSSSGQCSTRGFFDSSHLRGVEALSVCKKNQLHVKVSEATEGNEWTIQLNAGRESPKLRYNCKVGTIWACGGDREGGELQVHPCSSWCAGAASESSLRTGIPVGAAASAEVSIQEENRSPRARWNCCCSLPGSGGRRAPLEPLKWLDLPQPQLSLGWIWGRKTGTRIVRSCASHHHQGWVKI